GNQRELARQKNMKKQSDSVKGKRRDDGLSAASRRKRQTRRRRNPSGFVASCPTLSPFARVPGVSPTMPAGLSCGLTVRLRRHTLRPESARVPSVLPAPQVASLPLLPNVFYSCGAHPKVLKVALLKKKKRQVLMSMQRNGILIMHCWKRTVTKSLKG
ncbi:hypothetical protein FD755_006531, partial [Muntiacus reevesi]